MKKLMIAPIMLFASAALAVPPLPGPEAKVAGIARNVDAARMKATVGTAGTRLASGLNPPPENVEGLVRRIAGNLVSISIGSDAGLTRGHTMQVFRLGQNPHRRQLADAVERLGHGRRLGTEACLSGYAARDGRLGPAQPDRVSPASEPPAASPMRSVSRWSSKPGARGSWR